MTDKKKGLIGEEAIIQTYLRPLSQGWPGAFDLRDDCAALAPAPGHELIIKTDPVREGVHFFSDDSPADIAWKALAVNVSDLAAKAARPLAYTLALSFPNAPQPAWMQGFACGLSDAQSAFGCTLIGGDTDRAQGPLTIAVTVLGEAPVGRMVRRATPRVGDQIFVSGTLGDAAAGLQLRIGEVHDQLGLEERDYLLGRYLRPEPRIGLRSALRGFATAAMDISDGLAKDLGRMCRAAGVGARIRLSDIPISSAVLRACDNDRLAARRLFSSGDDYEVMCAVASEHCGKFVAAARRGGVTVTRIGEFTAADTAQLIDPDHKSIDWGGSGYDHF